MFKRIVRSIRKKPKAVKDQYAFGMAAIFTGIIAVWWVMSMTSGIQPVVQNEGELVESLPNESTGLREMVGELRQEVGNLTESVRTTVATSTATSTVETLATTTFTAPQTTSEVPQGNEVRIATFTASTTDQ